MYGYWLVSDEGRNGQRGGEWWESPEAFTRGDKDQQQNKTGFFWGFFAPWERETRVRPSQPYYKTTEEEGDVQNKGALWKIVRLLASFRTLFRISWRMDPIHKFVPLFLISLSRMWWMINPPGPCRVCVFRVPPVADLSSHTVLLSLLPIKHLYLLGGSQALPFLSKECPCANPSNLECNGGGQ